MYNFTSPSVLFFLHSLKRVVRCLSVAAVAIMTCKQQGIAQQIQSLRSTAATDTIRPSVYLQGTKLLPGITGPGSTQSPYLLPNKPGIKFTSVITTNDVVGSYRMAGIPDGLGAFDNGNGTFTVLMNHELNNTLGIIRAHGSKGAFVSKMIINKSDLSVISGSDLMQQVFLWDITTQSYTATTTAFSRFCSADLPALSAFYDAASGLGTTQHIYMNGEESGLEGRAVGHVVTGPDAGKSYELPFLGKFSWENAVASASSGIKTLVGGLDDGTGGQVYFYIGTKTNSGTEIDKAGLNNGKLFGVKVTGLLTETSAGIPAAGTRFSLSDMGFVQNMTGATLNTNSIASGVTTFLRPEDGAWDPMHPNDFYFVTTNSFNAPSRLWKLHFDNVMTPETGGTIEAVLDGTEGCRMLDNLTVDKLGNILLQEDVGNNSHIGKLWQYNIAKDSLSVIAYHDSSRFLIGGSNFLTQDEESSGVIDVSEILGAGMYLLDVQAHFAPAANTVEVVEGGQLIAMYNPSTFGKSTAADTLLVNTTDSLTAIALGVPSAADESGAVTPTNNAPLLFPVGTTVVIWTATDESGNTASVNQVVIVTRDNQAPSISITSPANGFIYTAGTPIHVTTNASDADGTVAKVIFYAGANQFAVDSIAPFEYTSVYEDAGTYKVTAKAFDNGGLFTVSDTVIITIEGCTPGGSISAEGFTNIPGSTLLSFGSSSKYPNDPDVRASLNKFEYGPNYGDNYGARVRGYICAPATGNYVFYISSDEDSELYLSTDDNAQNIQRIAFVKGAVGFRNWFAKTTQRSSPVRLVRGVRYYIESIHKEATGNDHLSVGWVLPNGYFEAPIAGNRLSPFQIISMAKGSDFALEMTKALATSIKGFTATASPNPSNKYFTITTRSSSNELISIKVIDATGRIVERKNGIAANSAVQVGGAYRSGIYFVEVSQAGNVVRIKLLKL